MSMRQWLNNNSAATTIGVVVILIICLVVILWSQGAVGTSVPDTQAYFYNIKTKKIVVGDVGKTLATADKGTVFSARVFSCTDCSDPKKRFVGWLERTVSPKMPANYKGPRPTPVILIKQPYAQSKWVSVYSPTGQAIQDAVDKQCKNIKPCYLNN